MTRPSIHEYFLGMALHVSTRGTCVRRKVGCVLVNDRNHVLATGYNGRPSGLTHCIDKPCAGALAPSGTQLDKCESIHAEANALLQCRDVYDIRTVYCTVAPCIHCTKLLMNTGAITIRYIEAYPRGSEGLRSPTEVFWRSSRAGRSWFQGSGAGLRLG
jgi:dCMP deaminase